MGITWSLFFPPPPNITERNLQSQNGKVFIVTGGYSGIGFELCKILYQAGGKVYLAGRSEEKAQAAIAEIKSLPLKNTLSTEAGDILFLSISLDDLKTIKPAVDTFTASESRLDVLFNNAGVSNPPQGSVSSQGHELQLATNCLGPHLFTQLLLPTLQKTARSSPSASVRVIWTGSIVVDLSAPKGGPSIADFEQPSTDQQRNYTNSKLGNWYLAKGLAEQAGGDGILSLAQNPGNLKTALVRHMPAIVPIIVRPLLYSANYGAYTALWTAFSKELTIDDGGKYVLPWGRLHPSPRADLLEAMKSGEDGTAGNGAKFVEFCDRHIGDFR
ncbi:putative short-chain dehydrogenase [Talaromyces proteolyticus]|uniref:Short-chain dehydrogenase n=1 Tax=Talaromyces proteolyticus TaxID=1131652 RepID=A0AAD4Q153_9EURO|nr:putative short-chain dehydrogenase [Talaromyces proteolyticus]KAH8705250.1 putative short-chain dehydrogenase [Talaromyces proteolyticus]